MSILLDFVYAIVLLACSPVLIYRSLRTGKYRDGWAEKFLGKVPRRLGDRPCVWFHAVSVGEVLLLKPIIAELSRRRPDWEIFISSTTATGLNVARQTFPDLVTFYAPLDFSWATRRAMNRVRPMLLALVELELWPNWIKSAKRMGARVAIVNGRLSGRSHRGYRRLRWAIGPTLWKIDAIAAQTQEYAERFVDLGAPQPHVRVTGSVKYDGLESDRGNLRTKALRQALGLSASEIVFVAGSTMQGEESAALAAFQSARLKHPKLRMVIVPRHAERFEAVANWLEKQHVRVVRRSRPGEIRGSGDHPPVVLVDTLGELSAVWGLADIAFVGGSLFPGRGGQNMMEPAAFGSSVIFGPCTSNFKEAVEGLLSRGGAKQVANAAELADALLENLDDPDTAAHRGAIGRAFVLAQNGASERTVATLDRLVTAEVAKSQELLALSSS